MAYKRQDGRFNLHYSHWGAKVETAGRITPATPFGGEHDMTPAYVGAFTAALVGSADDASDVAVNENIADPDDTPVKPDPMEIGVGFDGVIEEVAHGGPWYEMMFVVDTVYEDGETIEMPTRAYRVERDIDGDLLLLEPRERMGRGYWDDAYQRGWFRGVKDQCLDLVEHDVVDEETANERLLTAVVEKYADRLDRTVLAHSPAIRPEHHEQHPEAFIKFSGQTRVLGEMYPTNIREPAEWELPEGFPAVKTATGDRVELV